METTFTIRPRVVDVMSWRMTNQIIFISDVVSVLLSAPWLFDRRPLVTYTLPQYEINLWRDKNWSENENRSRVEIDLNLINHNEDVWVAINSRAFNFHLEVVHVERDAINTKTQWNITWTWWWCWVGIGRGNLSLIWLNDDGAEMKDALLVKRFVNYLLFGVNMNEDTDTHRTSYNAVVRWVSVFASLYRNEPDIRRFYVVRCVCAKMVFCCKNRIS